MRDQLKTFAATGVLANFVGMLTDSRSFLSYPRHEYFRRILCDYLGRLVDGGEYPYDIDMLGEIVKGAKVWEKVSTREICGSGSKTASVFSLC